MGATTKSQATPASKKSASIRSPIDDPLVPIRIELDVDGRHVSEFFTWNRDERRMTPEVFARVLCGDLGLDAEAVEAISESVKEQIDTYPSTAERERMCLEDEGESRQIIRLDLRVGRVLLRDQFEWDLNGEENSPETFAEGLCADLGLGLEFVPVVAHATREQLRELAVYRGRKRAPQPLSEDTVLRTDDADAWEPVVECLSIDEQERIERKESREARLARRNRGRARDGGRGVNKQRRRSRTTRAYR